MNLRLLLTSCLALVILPKSVTTAQSTPGSEAPSKAAGSSCPVTLPRKSPLQDFPGSNVYWEGNLFVASLPSDGTMAFPPDRVGSDGLLAQKFGWYRGPGLRGKLNIKGKRLDAPAPPLRVHLYDYGDTGFQPSTLIFSTEGCWAVTGRVDQTTLTFVIRVIKLVTAGAQTAPKLVETTTVVCPVTIGRKSPIPPAEFFGSGSAHWNGNYTLVPSGPMAQSCSGPAERGLSIPMVR